ncbi:MAG: 16S rRNA (guanine(527)-N(7))-methyltransferase RsmG [Nitrospirota bacterium]
MFHVERARRWTELLTAGASELGVTLTDRQVTELFVYGRELNRWNEKINLTAIRQDKEVAVKHFLDSLACSKALVPIYDHSLLDIGTGAGFPGLPLKILHPELDLTLLEPSLKKTAFLRHLIGTLHVRQAVVISKRIQDVCREPQHQGRFAYVVTRALGIVQVLPFIQPILGKRGRLILCRAKPLDDRMDLCGLRKTKELTYDLPYGYGKRVLTVLEPATSL